MSKKAKMNYPGYFLMTPDKELVQSCVIKDSSRLYEKTEKTFFGYPFFHDVVQSLIDTVVTLKPVYEALERLKVEYPSATFGSFMQGMLHRIKSEEKDKRESIFTWAGWAKAAEGVLGRDVH